MQVRDYVNLVVDKYRSVYQIILKFGMKFFTSMYPEIRLLSLPFWRNKKRGAERISMSETPERYKDGTFFYPSGDHTAQLLICCTLAIIGLQRSKDQLEDYYRNNCMVGVQWFATIPNPCCKLGTA